MMCELLNYAFQNGIHIIRENLSIVDNDHKEHLPAFKIIQYDAPKDYIMERFKKNISYL
jgi:hypothetical protein